jgi:hypothetical protein
VYTPRQLSLHNPRLVWSAALGGMHMHVQAFLAGVLTPPLRPPSARLCASAHHCDRICEQKSSHSPTPTPPLACAAGFAPLTTTQPHRFPPLAAHFAPLATAHTAEMCQPKMSLEPARGYESQQLQARICKRYQCAKVCARVNADTYACKQGVP